MCQGAGVGQINIIVRMLPTPCWCWLPCWECCLLLQIPSSGHAIPAIAPSHSDHTRQEAALITTICSAHSRPAEISIPHFVMMTQTYLKCLLLLHINTPNMTREENFEYRKYAARSSSAVIHSSHLQHCNERFIACIMCDGVRTVVTMVTTGSGSHLFSFTTITQQQLHLSRHVS